MIELNDYDLETLKKIELDILIEIDKICKKHNIKYSLAAGTLLGAVRHEGFIPWDDDIDIMMLREEYEKFLKLASEELNEKYFVLDYRENRYYGFPFAKIMANNTVMKEKSTSKTKVPVGVFVDIFPIDVASEKKLENESQYKNAQKLKNIMLCRGNYYFGQHGIKAIIWKLRRLIYLLIPYKKIVVTFEKLVHKHDKSNSNSFISLCGNVGVEKATYPQEWFQEYCLLPFENYKFMAIKEYKALLKKQYGDYMKLPSLSERKPHHCVVEFDISNYK